MKGIISDLSWILSLVVIGIIVLAFDYYHDVYKPRRIEEMKDKCYGYTVIDADHVVTCEGDTLIHCWQIPKCCDLHDVNDLLQLEKGGRYE